MGPLSTGTNGQSIQHPGGRGPLVATYAAYYEPEQSLNRPDRAVNSWKRAIAALPVENLTAAEKKQRQNYTAELAAAQAKLVDLEANPKEPENIIKTNAADRLPWNRAAALIPGLQASGQWNSSVRRFCLLYREGLPLTPTWY